MYTVKKDLSFRYENQKSLSKSKFTYENQNNFYSGDSSCGRDAT